MKVDNAVIMAAGTSSRFAPLSYEHHKALTIVKGEVLIERQIEQLKEAGVPEIYIITGYKSEQFEYLVPKYGAKLIYNPDYLSRNNNASIWAAREILGNSYICSSDNYFVENPFEAEVDDAYYAAEYASRHTAEWCMKEDEQGYISAVTIGGEEAWYMLGHAFWSHEFSRKFISILSDEYNLPETADKLWEKILIAHLDVLKMRIRKYAPGVIYEFDTIDELRKFDESYVKDTKSTLLKRIADELNVMESDLGHIESVKGQTAAAIGFKFECCGRRFLYNYKDGKLSILYVREQ